VRRGAAGPSGDLIADRRFEYARGYAEAGDHAAAADLLEQTLELVPGWPPALVALGEARAALGDGDAAAAAFRAALARDPGDVLGAGLKLAALGAAPVPPAPPDAYVRGLFDDYAGRFEKALVEDLGYRTPWRMGELLQAAAPGRRFAHGLDLGCGTGLMGAVLRPLCDRLDGVDLSPGMLAEAARKGLYDTLAEGDAARHLAAAGEPLDLVAAADVFVYVGDLAPVFAAAARRLAPGGLFVFSVEAAAGDGFLLRDSLRYAHSGGYVRRAAAAAGLGWRMDERTVLRFDRGAPVHGMIAVLERHA
jgi:predicted TPR repeat methyltransferase